jgi:hypothetical protein
MTIYLRFVAVSVGRYDCGPPYLHIWIRYVGMFSISYWHGRQGLRRLDIDFTPC